MKVHLAETGFILQNIKNGRLKNKKFPILFTFYNKTYANNFKNYYKHATSLIVDSGAFTFQKTGLDKLNEYVEEYKRFINTYKDYPNTYFVELDIENQIGYKKVKQIRKELTKITPNIIPVWHTERGLNDYKKTVRKYDYVGISGVNSKDFHTDKELGVFVNYAHRFNTKVHGFGIHRPQTLKTVQFDSVDATSWLKKARFGKDGNKKIDSNYLRKNYKDIAYMELLEGLKKVNYYEQYWKNHNKGK